MSADRYVIVYRDGYMSLPADRAHSDYVVESFRGSPAVDRPAYRIRIREKFTPGPNLRKAYARLDPELAYREVTGRTTFAGAE